MEEEREDKDGNSVSYNPPRYHYSYDFHMTIHVNHPYFNEISFDLNSSEVETTKIAVIELRKPNPGMNQEYKKYEEMGNEIKRILLESRQEAREAVKEAAAPKAMVICPWCGASTQPDASGCCEYCGGAV